MAILPVNPLSLSVIIDNAIEAQQEDSRRRHLGASQIGHPCQRKLWYDFRWCAIEKHGARLLRLFGRGHLEEVRFIKYLRDAGVVIDDVNPATGRQFTVTACKGHFGGSLDGIGHNVPEAPITEHLFEFKTHGDKSFKELRKKGMRAAKPEHYAQMQVYMELRELTRGVYMAVNKNDDDIYIERVRYDKDHAYMMLQKAENIIFSPEPPLGICPNQTRMECSWCSYRGICAGIELPEKSCRTCKHVEPIEGKNWYCSKYQTNVNYQSGAEYHENDRLGCASYEIIPSMQIEGV